MLKVVKILLIVLALLAVFFVFVMPPAPQPVQRLKSYAALLAIAPENVDEVTDLWREYETEEEIPTAEIREGLSHYRTLIEKSRVALSTVEYAEPEFVELDLDSHQRLRKLYYLFLFDTTLPHRTMSMML